MANLHGMGWISGGKQQLYSTTADIPGAVRGCVVAWHHIQHGGTEGGNRSTKEHVGTPTAELQCSAVAKVT